MEEPTYQVIITVPAKDRYQDEILPYLHNHFSFDRAKEIDHRIIETATSLTKHPERGRIEEHLRSFKKSFRFILFQETRNFELKLIYFIDELEKIVHITDFFPTRMHPDKMSKS